MGIFCLLTVSARTLGASEADLGLLADSVVWQAHFESWVDRFLIEPEVREAREELPPLDSEATYRAVLELTERRVRSLERPTALPEELVPRLAARGLSGEAIRIARLHVQGEQEEALRALEDPTLERTPDVAHLRAQLLDEITRDAPPWRRLEIIQEYRTAISLDRSLTQTARARLRIAQIHLEIGFVREAAATLRPWLDPPLPRPYGTPAALTFAEAAYRAEEYESALATLDAVPRKRLLGRTLPWVLRRRAELLFRLEEYDRAARAYAEHAEALGDAADAEPDALSQLRRGFSLLKSGRNDEARASLAKLYTNPGLETIHSPSADDSATGKPSLPTNGDSAAATEEVSPNEAGQTPNRVDPNRFNASLVGLLRVQAEQQRSDFHAMQKLAQEVLARHPEGEAVPLLATSILEAQRLQGGDRPPPPGLADLADFDTRDPARALLSFRVELERNREATELGEEGAERTTIERLATLARGLPDGPVKALIHDEMAHRLLATVRHAGAENRLPDPALLTTMQTELSARQMEENGLLLAVEAFRDSGRLKTCVRWALALREREVRPVRRGMGAWREQQCRREADDEPPDRDDLLRISDSGTAGPFSLAFAVLAAETFLRADDLAGAVGVYERGLESFAEPGLVGPVLLRLGELHAAAQRDGLARQRVVRGLGVTDAPESATDPLRKLGLLVLAEQVTRRGDGERLQTMLRTEIARTAPWWPSAYTFLGRQAGLSLPPPKGADPFARADETLARGRRLRDRLAAIAARAPAAPDGELP